MKIGSLCSGAGGLDLAAEAVFGARTVWHSELEKLTDNKGRVRHNAATDVLAAHWPGVPNHGDLTTVDWDEVEPVDILTGGFPCQPFSHAGKRKGADDERHIWPGVREAIRRLRPRYTFLENVPGLRSLGFDRVLGDLAEDGLHARWVSVRASDVGSCHARERLWILVTDPARERVSYGEVGGGASGLDVSAVAGAGDRDRAGRAAAGIRQLGRASAELAAVVGLCATCAEALRNGESSWYCPDPNVCNRWDEPLDLLPTPAASRSGRNRSLSPGAAVRPSLDMIGDLLPTPSAADGGGGHLTRSGARSGELLLPGLARAYGNGELLPTPTSRDAKGQNQRGDTTCLTGALLPTPNAADSHRGPDLARANRVGSGGDDLHTFIYKTDRDHQWGKYAPAITRWERLTRPAPSPTEPNTKGNPRLNPAFSQWMMGWPEGWVTAVSGISRNDQLRIIGNGVVPQQAIAALRWLLSLGVVA